ncbi:MAG: class I SAM-dependent methyltransferase [Elusimicrobia bacterium]|nr:class I SAM-dependent methyltransferase [Elusimicrobiota bacterium]
MWGRAYDAALAPVERLCLSAARRRLLASATGRTLELGLGTGLNLPHYPPSAWLAAVEPDASMSARARARRPGLRLVRAAAEALPLKASCFDTVVATLVLCSVKQPAEVAAEAFRVLRPGGRFLLLEHVRPPGRLLSPLFAAAAPAWAVVAGGCRLDRDPWPALAAAGFAVETVETGLRGIVKVWTLRKP